MNFTHLHVHSNFSFLDGGSSVGQLLDRAKEVGCESLALTDHNGLYGAVRFYDYAKRIGIKPIIGVELDLESGHHLVLLGAKPERLLEPVQDHHPRPAFPRKGERGSVSQQIEQYKDDLFCLSGCIKGEVPSLLSQGNIQAAREAAEVYAGIFGPENFFIELGNHMLPGDGAA